MTDLDWLGRCIERIGHGNGKGQISFNKSVTFTMLMIFAALIGAVIWWILHTLQLPPAGLMAVILGFGTLITYAGFGLKGLAMHKGANLVTTQINANETAELKAAEMIRATREKHLAPAPEHREPVP